MKSDGELLRDYAETRSEDAFAELVRRHLDLVYFEKRQHAEIGAKLGVSENTARMRVERALEKPHAHLARRGVTTTAAALSAAISANAVQAAPASLSAVITTTAAALAGTTLTTAATATATKAIAMTSIQKTLITATIVAAVSTGLYEARQASRWRTQVQTLERQQASLAEQIAQLNSDNENLSNRVAPAIGSPSLSSDRLRELLRLRGEVGMLKRKQRELEQAAAAAPSKTRGLTEQSTSAAVPPSAVPAPFQVQLVLDGPGENAEPMTNSAGGETLHVQKTPLLDHTAIRGAAVTRNELSGTPQIDIEFSEVGKELFAAVTKENINKRLAIVVDGHLYSAPVIRSEISEGKAQITGSFTEEEARALAAKINDAISGQ